MPEGQLLDESQPEHSIYLSDAGKACSLFTP